MRLILFISILSCFPSVTKAQEHFYDFYKFGKNSTPESGNYFNNGNYVLLQGANSELWVSDGTAAGTTLLKDCSTDDKARFGGFIASGRYTFFMLYCVTGKEIWVTDGTAAGTRMFNKVKQLKYSNGSIGVFNGWLFYTYILDDNTYQIRRADTTSFTDTLVKTFKRGYNNQQSDFASTDSFIYFGYDDSIFRIGKNMGPPQFFWQRDAGSGDILGLRTYKNVLLWFMRDYNLQETHFYASKEMKGSTKDIASYKSWYYIIDMEGMGNAVYFTANTDLFKVDMSTLSTTKLTSQSKPLAYSAGEIIAYNNKIYFQGTSFLGARTELWSTNATNTATQIVTTISQDTSAPIAQFQVVNNTLLFNAYTRNTGREFYRCLGTSGSTSVISDIMPGASSSILGYYPTYYGIPTGSSVVFKNKLFFAAYTHAYGNEPWISDGTTAGTQLLKDINNDFNYGDQEVNHLMVAGDYLFVGANDSLNGAELWRTDGSKNGTILVHNITLEFLPTEFGDQIEYKNKLFMSAFSLIDGQELYTSNGKTGSVNSFYVTLGSLFTSSSPHMFVVKEPYLYYLGSDALFGADNLYRSDGTRLGTAPLNKGINNSYKNVSQLYKPGNLLYFSAEFSQKGTEPMVSDGSIDGTKLLKDVNTGTGSSNPAYFCGNDTVVYFSAADASGNYGIYRSNGTETGTSRMLTFEPNGFSNKTPDTMFYHQGKIIFRSYYTGTNFPNTSMLAVWNTLNDSFHILQPLNGETYGDPRYMTILNNRIIFRAAGTQSGNEPWVTDGTRAGTTLLKDIMTGSTSSQPGSFTVYNGLVYFSATDNMYGREAWVSDGTASATSLLWDIEPGSKSGNPTAFAGYKGYVYLAANQGARTQSLFRIQADSCQQFALRLRNGNTFNTLCANSQASLFVESGFDNSRIKWFRNDTLLAFTNDTIKTGIPGIYQVQADSQACHTVSNTLRIERSPKMDVRIRYTADSAFCEGSSLGLTQSDKEIQTRWFRNNTFVIAGNTMSTNTAGKIYAIGSNGFGCTDTSNMLQPVMNPRPVPVITRTNDSLFCNIAADSFQWLFNNAPISKATKNFVKLQASGNYTVEAYSDKGCKGVSAVYKYTNVSVKSKKSETFKIYPNPASNTLTIELEDMRSISIVDVTGKTCLTFTGDSKQLNIAGLEEGMYMVVIETSTSVLTGTFMKVK